MGIPVVNTSIQNQSCSRQKGARKINPYQGGNIHTAMLSVIAIGHGIDIIFKQDGNSVLFPDTGQEIQSLQPGKIIYGYYIINGFPGQSESDKPDIAKTGKDFI